MTLISFVRAEEIDREFISQSIRSMQAWLEPRYLDGSARIEDRCIVLSAALSQRFVIAELSGRLFIGVDRPETRWLDRLPWKNLLVPGAHDLKGRHATLNFDGRVIGQRYFGKPMTSFSLSLTVEENVLRCIRQHAQVDFRVCENGKISREILNTIAVKCTAPLVGAVKVESKTRKAAK